MFTSWFVFRSGLLVVHASEPLPKFTLACVQHCRPNQCFRVSKSTLLEMSGATHSIHPSPPMPLVSVSFHWKELRSSGAPELPPSAAAARSRIDQKMITDYAQTHIWHCAKCQCMVPTFFKTFVGIFGIVHNANYPLAPQFYVCWHIWHCTQCQLSPVSPILCVLTHSAL